MASRLNPYLNFRGQAREALDFYASVFGGDVAVSTFGEFGDPPPGSQATDVMHGQLETSMGFTLMVSDVPSSMELTVGDNITVSLSGDDVDALHGYWERLSADGTVVFPLERQMWGDEFGQCKDRFGVPWLVNITAGA
ncbi:VOC family protein [Microlunatus antarcticus]|uniref:PhnB protein n=1 Tax=Microlunatus antarcticus TaxID=53388 RepID=A0A7W5JYL2_9ACTN|nr:VOC family protein [Microlunatus antarcticus]MBB3328638.1 PhnB protein [Microlunatus antarcticus]